jgi:hypothetical protein
LFSALKGKINQNDINYAKRTQFSKKSNVYNRSFDNELQQKMQIGHLVKTNPNEPNSKPIKPNLYCVYSCSFVVKFKTKPKQTQSVVSLPAVSIACTELCRSVEPC